MTERAASPRPWRVVESFSGTSVEAADGTWVLGHNDDNWSENMELLVKCVNRHDELVQGIKSFMDEAGLYRRDFPWVQELLDKVEEVKT